MSLLFEHWPRQQLAINQNSLELPAPYAAQCQGQDWCLRARWLVGAVGAAALQLSVGARRPPKQPAAKLLVLAAAKVVGLLASF